MLDVSNTIMAPSFVRGNIVYVHSVPPMWAGANPPRKGDRLTVGARKKGGWLRVRNHRNGDLTSLRVGAWIQKDPVPKNEPQNSVPTFNIPAQPSSGIDQLIRANQIQTLEARIQKMSDDFFNEKTRLEACIDRLTQTNEIQTREIESYQRALDNQRTEAATSAIQLVEAKSKQVDLYEKLQAAELKVEEAIGKVQNMNADAEAYHRRVDELEAMNEGLRHSENCFAAHLERVTKELHEIRPIGPIYSHKDFDWVYPEELEEEEAEEVDRLHGSGSC